MNAPMINVTPRSDSGAETAVDPAFVYVVYIQTTPQTLWDALTDPKAQRRYWFDQHTDTDWKVGSPLAHRSADGSANFVGEVLVSDPPRELTFTFHSTEQYPIMHAEGPTRASYLIEDVTAEGGRPMVRLTLTHDGFSKAGSRTRQGVSGGWSAILSNLKTLLETGETLPAFNRG
jgi:uncharacterized protein YndB with AHSA1/START domain